MPSRNQQSCESAEVAATDRLNRSSRSKKGSKKPIGEPRNVNDLPSYNKGKVDSKKKKCVFNESPSTQKAWTTVMIQGIPWGYEECDLLRILAELIGPTSFDFFYMPWNFEYDTNNGCAFVNFITPENAQKCVDIFCGYTFGCGGKAKPCMVVKANLQGLVANVDYYRRRLVGVSKHAHAPIIFQDGVCLNFRKVTKDFCLNNSTQGNPVVETNTEWIEDLCSTHAESVSTHAESVDEFPRPSQSCLLANTLSLGASFSDDFAATTERLDCDWGRHSNSPQMDLTDFGCLDDARKSAQPADTRRTVLEASWTDLSFPQQKVEDTTERARLVGDTFRKLQQSLDQYLSQQSLFYAQQREQEAPEPHVQRTATTSSSFPISSSNEAIQQSLNRYLSQQSLYYAQQLKAKVPEPYVWETATTSASTTSPREAMQTLSESDDDIRRDQFFHYTFCHFKR